MKGREIGCCGLDCDKCESKIATINDDDELRKKVADYWSELNGVEILPEMINCEGCRFDGVKTYYCEAMCEIRKCALKNGFSTCADCGEMKDCDTLKQITSHSEEALSNLNK